MNGKLLLEDGAAFAGRLLNPAQTVGEVVFNTGMTGYQEILTDPSYCRQIVVLTYPLVGNYGIAERFMQSRRSFVNGFVIGELCDHPSSWQMEDSLGDFLTKEAIPCLYDVDTRAEIYTLENDGPRVVVWDFGIKKNILRSLHKWGCDLTVVPAGTRAEEIMALRPDGIFLSNGPGDPKDIPEAVDNIKKILEKKPIFGICLGHQLLALALGADTYKLKFGHRGSNQPVKNLQTGRVQITSQNHGYAVDEASLAGRPLTVTHRSVNDGTVEGLRHTDLPVFSVQFHPEAAPGSDDNTYLFDQFMDMLAKGE